ncbi:hypothetical protein FRC12_005492 [Ceratobasidium sp. 428]|nr:hypothetical protein FRC09_019165 [Ceratobasidium sp. 395]KAG8768568.1 hypothetical protein FRC12_005492 [Ceratobasidium sp. 428]
MSSSSPLPAEITLQIVSCMFQQADLPTGAGAGQHPIHLRRALWREIAGVTCANHSMRLFAFQLWFSTFLLRKPSDLRDGLRLFPSLPLWVSRLFITISYTWAESDLSVFSEFQRLEEVAFIEHNDASPAEGHMFLIEALQRIPRTRLTHLCCSFADTEYLGSAWPYLGEFPQLQELRLLVCSPASCARRPRLPRLALAEVRMPLLEDINVEIMSQALARSPKLRKLYTGVFTISRGSLLMHWGTHELERRNSLQYDPWASDCLQCRTDAVSEARRQAELASFALAKNVLSLQHIEWSSWFAPMKGGTLALDVTRDEYGEIIDMGPVFYGL